MEQAETVLVLLREGLYGFRPVDGMAVDNEKDRTVGVVDQSFDELKKLGGIDPSLYHHEPELPLGGDGGDHVQSEAAPGTRHDGCLPLHSPSGACMVIGAYSRLVAEEDAGLHGLRKLFDPEGIPR